MTTGITLNNGVVMPAIGLGVFQTPPEATTQAAGTARETGIPRVRALPLSDSPRLASHA